MRPKRPSSRPSPVTRTSTSSSSSCSRSTMRRGTMRRSSSTPACCNPRCMERVRSGTVRWRCGRPCLPNARCSHRPPAASPSLLRRRPVNSSISAPRPPTRKPRRRPSVEKNRCRRRPPVGGRHWRYWILTSPVSVPRARPIESGSSMSPPATSWNGTAAGSSWTPPGPPRAVGRPSISVQAAHVRRRVPRCWT